MSKKTSVAELTETESVAQNTEVVMNEAPKALPRVLPKPRETIVYIGPTIPKTELVTGRVFVVGETTLEARFKSEFEKMPSAKKLFVPIAQLGGARNKLRTVGNALSVAYENTIKEMEGTK